MPLVCYKPEASVGQMWIDVTFTDESSGATSWRWDFGDGTSSTLQSPPAHRYYRGSYVVTLTTNGPDGPVFFSDTVTFYDEFGSSTPAYTRPDPVRRSSRGQDPMMMLRLSNDGGKTWVCEMQRRAGRSGEYWRRVRWDRLGQARRRVFEVSVTDPIPWRLVGAYVKMTPARRV